MPNHPTLARAAELLLTAAVPLRLPVKEQKEAFDLATALRTLVVVDAGELERVRLKALQDGYDIARDNAEVSEVNDCGPTDPFIDWDCAYTALNRALERAQKAGG